MTLEGYDFVTAWLSMTWGRNTNGHQAKRKYTIFYIFFFDKGEKANQTIYGYDTVTYNHAEIWFHRFHSGNFSVKDAPRSKRKSIRQKERNYVPLEQCQATYNDNSRPASQKLRELGSKCFIL